MVSSVWLRALPTLFGGRERERGRGSRTVPWQSLPRIVYALHINTDTQGPFGPIQVCPKKINYCFSPSPLSLMVTPFSDFHHVAFCFALRSASGDRGGSSESGTAAIVSRHCKDATESPHQGHVHLPRQHQERCTLRTMQSVYARALAVACVRTSSATLRRL